MPKPFTDTKVHDKMMAALKRPTPREANFAFSGDFEDGPEPELMQCDCCGEMVPVDEIDFIEAGALGNSAGCDTYQCQGCYERARKAAGFPTEAEIARSQARLAAVLGSEEIAKLDAEALPIKGDGK